MHDRDALGFHCRVPLDDVKSIIKRFDHLDLRKFRIYVRLNIRANEFEDFVQERSTVVDCFVGQRVNPLILVLVEFDCNLRFWIEHAHDLMRHDCRFPALQKLLATDNSDCISSPDFTSSHIHFRDLKYASNWSWLCPITRAPNLVGIDSDVCIRDLIPCLAHVSMV